MRPLPPSGWPRKRLPKAGFQFRVSSQFGPARNWKLETGNLVALLTLELRIEGAHSLKDKRQVLRSLKDRLRTQFNVAVAELDHTDLWQRATLGVVSISDSRDYLDGLMQSVERQSMRLANNAGAEVADSFLEFL